MSDSSISDIFNLLVDKKKVVIHTGSAKEHDLLRVRLVKFFSTHKKLLDSIGAGDDSINLSLSAEYNTTDGSSSYFIRERKKFAPKNKRSYQIISDDDSS